MNLNTKAEELIELRNKAAQAYYSPGGTPIMSDAEFDTLLAELKTLGVDEVPGHGYDPEADLDLPDVKHEYKMQSLRKVHEEEDILRWQKNMAKGAEFIIQPKYDGLALNIVYNEDGDFIQAATRGDHTHGKDVTATVRGMIQHGIIPATIDNSEYNGNTHVRGELYMNHASFAALNEYQASIDGRIYGFTRNAASGLLMKGDSKTTKFLSFVAYDSNHYDADEVEFLDAVGFETPKDHYYVTAKNITEIMTAVNELGIKRFSEFEFDTDGAVVKLKANRETREDIGSNSSHPKWAVAYKYPEVPLPTIIRDVVWNHNRTGKLTPVAIFDPVVLVGEARTTRATLANYDKFQFFSFRPGDQILLIRANGVIPFIVGLDPQATRPDVAPFGEPKFFPTEDFPTSLNSTGKYLMAHPDAPEPLSAIIENSVKKMDLKNVGIAFIEEMLEAGRITSFLDMLSLTHDELVEIRGIELKTGEKSRSSEVVVEALQKSFDKPLWRWIGAMGIHMISTSRPPVLEARYKSLDALAEAKMSELVKLDKFNGTVAAQSLIDNLSTVKEWADRLRDEYNFVPKPEDVKEVETSTGEIDVNGKKVVVTGLFPTMKRGDVETWVKNHGGTIGSSVSGSTDILIYGEKAGSKLDKAKSVGSVELIKAATFERDIS